jgi:hypothetical protein
MAHEEEGFIRVTPFKRYYTPRYQTIFLGLCYACNNFGHKAVNCRDDSRSINSYPRRSSEKQRISYRRFESLRIEVECYKCNNFGYMAKNCRMTVPPREPQKKTIVTDRILIREHGSKSRINIAMKNSHSL